MVKFLYYAVNEASPRILDEDLNNHGVFHKVCKSFVDNHALRTVGCGGRIYLGKNQQYSDGTILYRIIRNYNFLWDDTRPINECAIEALCGKVRGFIHVPIIRDAVLIMKFEINGGQETYMDCEDIDELTCPFRPLFAKI